jgi:hypothetical protein
VIGISEIAPLRPQFALNWDGEKIKKFYWNKFFSKPKMNQKANGGEENFTPMPNHPQIHP